MKFPCTGCGACCANVQGEPWLSELTIREDGSCANYDRWTKRCLIYDARPEICRVMDDDDHEAVLKHCDRQHLEIYGEPREQSMECDHEEPRLRLQFETVSTCNAACHFCVYPKVSSMRRGNTMDMDLFKRVVDEAAGIPSIAIYSMQGLGEPFLDPLIADRIRYIKEKDPNSNVELFTNGLLAAPHKVDGLHEAGLDCIVFSLNAVTGKQHDRVMGMKGKFDKICEQIQYAQSLPDWNVRVHATGMTPEENIQLVERWGDACKPTGIGNWAGEFGYLYPEKDYSKSCHRALSGIYVMYDGRITMCCFDPTGKTIFGDLNKQTLREIYASDKYVKFREDHFNDRADRYEQCAGCSRI